MSAIAAGSWVWVTDPERKYEIGAQVTSVNPDNSLSVVTTSSKIVQCTNARLMSNESMYSVLDLSMLPEQDQNTTSWSHNIWAHYARHDLNPKIGPSSSILLCPPPQNAAVTLNDLLPQSPLYIALQELPESVVLAGPQANRALTLSLDALVKLGHIKSSTPPRVNAVLCILAVLCGTNNDYSAFSLQIMDQTAFQVSISPELTNVVQGLPNVNLFSDILGSKSGLELQLLGLQSPFHDLHLQMCAYNASRYTEFCKALDLLHLSELKQQVESMSAAALILSKLDFIEIPGTSNVQRISDPGAMRTLSNLLQIPTSLEQIIFVPPLNAGVTPIDKACKQRDEAVIGLYACITNWVVASINNTCGNSQSSNSMPIITMHTLSNQADVAIDLYSGKATGLTGILPSSPFGKLGNVGAPLCAPEQGVRITCPICAPEQGVRITCPIKYFILAIPVSGTPNLYLEEVRDYMSLLIHKDESHLSSVPQFGQTLNLISRATSLVNVSTHTPHHSYAQLNSTNKSIDLLPPTALNSVVVEDADIEEEASERERQNKLLAYLERTDLERTQAVQTRLENQIKKNIDLMDRVQAYPSELQSLLAVLPHIVQQLVCESKNQPYLPCTLVPHPIPVLQNATNLPVGPVNQIIRTALSQNLAIFERQIILNYMCKSALLQGMQEVDRMYVSCLDNSAMFPDAWRWITAMSCLLSPSSPVQNAIISQSSTMGVSHSLLELIVTNWATRLMPRRFGITYIEVHAIWNDSPLLLNVKWADSASVSVMLHPSQQVISIVQGLLAWRKLDIAPTEYTLRLSGLGIDSRLSPYDSFFDMLCLYQQLYEVGSVTLHIERLYIQSPGTKLHISSPVTHVLKADRSLCHMQLAQKYPDLMGNLDEGVQRAQDSGLWAMRFPAIVKEIATNKHLSAYWIVCTKSRMIVERMDYNGTDVALASHWDDFVITSASPQKISFMLNGENQIIECSGEMVVKFIEAWIVSIKSDFAVLVSNFTSKDGLYIQKGISVQVKDEKIPWVLVIYAEKHVWVPRSHIEYLIDPLRVPALQNGQYPLRIIAAMRQTGTSASDISTMMGTVSLTPTLKKAPPPPTNLQNGGYGTVSAHAGQVSQVMQRAAAPFAPTIRGIQVVAQGGGVVGTMKRKAPPPPMPTSPITFSMPHAVPNSVANSVRQGMDIIAEGTMRNVPNPDPYVTRRTARRATDSSGNSTILTDIEVPQLFSLRLTEYSMEQFANQHFETKSGTIFGGKKKLALDGKFLQYSEVPLKKPLTRAVFEVFKNVKLAADISTWILSYMGDLKCKAPLEMLKNIIDISMSCAELKDETFCQIVKQIHNNPRPDGVQQGLKLLAMCGIFFHPGSELFPNISRFLQTLVQNQPNLADAAQRAYSNMYKSSVLTCRNLGPSSEELESISNNALIKFRVELPNKTARSFLIDSFSLCSELLIKLQQRYFTEECAKDYMLVLDCGPRNGMHPLPIVPIIENDRLADFIRFAENLTLQHDLEKESVKEDIETKNRFKSLEACRIVYTRLFWPQKGAGTSKTAREENSDNNYGAVGRINTAAMHQKTRRDSHLPPLIANLPLLCSHELLDWTFEQLRVKFLNGDLISAAELRPTAHKEITYLISLLVIIMEPEDIKDVIPQLFLEHSDNIFMKFKANIDSQVYDWKESITQETTRANQTPTGSNGNHHSKLTSSHLEQARIEFIERIRATFQFFGTVPFHIYGSSDARMENGGLMLIGELGIFILDEKSRKTIMTVDYEEIVDIASEGDEVTLRTQNMLQKRIIRFMTAQHFILMDVIQHYKTVKPPNPTHNFNNSAPNILVNVAASKNFHGAAP